MGWNAVMAEVLSRGPRVLRAVMRVTTIDVSLALLIGAPGGFRPVVRMRNSKKLGGKGTLESGRPCYVQKLDYLDSQSTCRKHNIDPPANGDSTLVEWREVGRLGRVLNRCRILFGPKFNCRGTCVWKATLQILALKRYNIKINVVKAAEKPASNSR